MDNTLVSLISFKNFIALFNTEKIEAIYVDTAEDEIKSRIYDNIDEIHDIFSDYPNLLDDMNYLTTKNNSYVIDKDKIFKDYENYHVSYFVPRLSEDVSDKVIKELDKIEDENEYIRTLSKYALSCSIVIKPSLDIDAAADFWPQVELDFDGYVLADVDQEDLDEGVTPFRETIVCVLKDDSKMHEVLSKRKNYITAVYKIKNGFPDVYSSVLYYTDNTGFVQNIGDFNIEVTTTEEEVDGEENETN